MSGSLVSTRILVPLSLLVACTLTAPGARAQSSPGASPAAGTSQSSTPFALPSGPIPKEMFGTAYTGQYVADFTNDDYTCNWALICDLGMPDMHSADAVSMGRSGGWAEAVKHTWKHAVNGKKVTSEIAYVFTISSWTPPNEATTMPAVQTAYQDFISAVQNVGLKNLSGQQFVDASYGGDSTFLRKTAKTHTYYAASFWASNIDVEAIAFCTHCTAAQTASTQDHFLAAMHTLGGTTG